MIIGAHSIIYSTSPDSDRTFLRDVLKLPNVDVGEGWLIFGLPPAEVAVHLCTIKVGVCSRRCRCREAESSASINPATRDRSQ